MKLFKNRNNEPGKTVVLHLGVHKTGTTYLQSRLANSIEELNNAKIGYIELKEIRANLTSNLGKPWFTANDIKEVVNPYFGGDTLIISDENILGGTEKIDSGKLYPKASGRLKKLATGLSDFEVIVHITIRDYVNYLISRYTEYLRHFDFLNFSDYYQALPYEKVSWLPLLEDIQDIGFKKIIISDFDAVFSNDNRYLNQLVGKPIKVAEATNNRYVKRGKLTNEGYETVEFFSQKYSQSATRYLIGVIDGNEQETVKTSFMPFTSAQKQMLDRLYLSDVEKIKSDSRWNYFEG